jgi:hypothetical protein
MKIEFNEQQLQVLNLALVDLPYRVAAPLINHINAQIQKQFDVAKGDYPTGQETPKDNYKGD